MEDVVKGMTKKSICWGYIKKGDVPCPIPYDGVPYINLGSSYYSCHLGVDKSKSNKLKYQHEKVMKMLLADNDPTIKIRNKRSVPTKKVSCPAKFNVKKIWRFPEYKLPVKHTSWMKQTTTKEIRQVIEAIKLSGFDKTVGRLEYVTNFPTQDCHKFHEPGKADWSLEPLDPQVEKFLRSEVRKGCIRSQELQQRGVNFVKNVLFSNEAPPNEQRRRFYPNKKKVRNLMGSEQRKMKAEADIQHQNVLHLNQLLDAVNEDLVGHTVTIEPNVEEDSDSQPDESLIEQVNSQLLQKEHHFEDLNNLQRTSKLKKLALLGKLEDVTALCHDIKHSQVEVIDAISDNIDSVIQFAKDHMETSEE